MITEKHVMATLAASNPIPDIDEIDLAEVGRPIYLATLEQGRNEMSDVQLRPSTKSDQESERQDKSDRSRFYWWVAAAVAAVVLGAVGYLLAADNPASEPDVIADPTPPIVETAPDPESVLGGYIDAYNAGDLDGVMVFFTEESNIVGHPYSPSGRPLEGLDTIRSFQNIDMTAGAQENAYTISNVEVSGDSVTWDHVWIDDQGQQFCKYGMSAVVEDGKFASFTFPEGFGCR